MKPTHDQVVINYTLAGAFSLLLLAVIFSMRQSHTNSNFAAHKRLFHILLCVVLTIRVFTFLAVAQTLNKWQGLVVLSATMVSGFTFALTFFVFLTLWATTYRRARQELLRQESIVASHRPLQRLISTHLVPVTIYLTIELSVIVTDIVLRARKSESSADARLASRIVAGVDAGLNLVCAVGFFWYGARLIILLNSILVTSRRKNTLVQKIVLVTLLCTSCFALRGTLLIVESAFCHHCSDNTVDIFGVSFYVIGEFLPIVATLVIAQTHNTNTTPNVTAPRHSSWENVQSLPTHYEAASP